MNQTIALLLGFIYFPSFVSTKSLSNYFWQDAIELLFSFHHHPSYEVCGPTTFKDIVITIYMILFGFYLYFFDIMN
jgi:hypothetical protein